MNDNINNIEPIFDNGRNDLENAEGFSDRTKLEDKELNQLLVHWKAPEVSLSTKHRLFAAYQQQTTPVKFWQRIFTTSIRVPVPIAAAFAILFIGLSLLFINTQKKEAVPAIPPPEQVRIVEVPVVQEKIIKQIIYSYRKPRQGIEKKHSDPAEAGPSLVAFDGLGNKMTDYGQPQIRGFQPADDMKVRIIKKGNSNEK